uniref:Uncharacterized protein n=1 Tax=Romanomermis culicivorax TaxID=13658 RepID=A0A915JL51_ROMCU
MLLLYLWTRKRSRRIFPKYRHDTGMPLLPTWSSLIVLFWSPLAVLANVVPITGAKLLPDVYWNSSILENSEEIGSFNVCLTEQTKIAQALMILVRISKGVSKK